MQYEAMKAINKAIAEYLGWTQLPKMGKFYHIEWGERVMNWLPPGQTAAIMSKDSPPNYFEDVRAVLDDITINCDWWKSKTANGWTQIDLCVKGKQSRRCEEEFGTAFVLAFWEAIKKEEPDSS